jgi:hypothetical protein
MVAVFETCMTIRTERDVGFLPRKGRLSVVGGDRCAAGRSVGPAPPSEPNTMTILSERRVESRAGGGGCLGSREGVGRTRGRLQVNAW